MDYHFTRCSSQYCLLNNKLSLFLQSPTLNWNIHIPLYQGFLEDFTFGVGVGVEEWGWGSLGIEGWIGSLGIEGEAEGL